MSSFIIKLALSSASHHCDCCFAISLIYGGCYVSIHRYGCSYVISHSALVLLCHRSLLWFPSHQKVIIVTVVMASVIIVVVVVSSFIVMIVGMAPVSHRYGCCYIISPCCGCRYVVFQSSILMVALTSSAIVIVVMSSVAVTLVVMSPDMAIVVAVSVTAEEVRDGAHAP